MKINLSILYY